MTQPVGHGFPDYGRFIATADKMLFNQLPTIDTNPKNFGPFFVGDVSYLGLAFSSGGGSAHQIVLRFYLDAALTVSMGAYTADLQGGGNLITQIGVQGPYVRIEIVPAVVGSTLSLKLWTSHSQYGFSASPMDNVLISINGGVAGAGATVTTNATNVRPGPASWIVFTGAVAWSAHLYVLSYLGVLTLLDSINAATANTSRRIFLPLAQVQVQFTNNDAAPKNYDTTVTVQPYFPAS